MNSNPNNIFYTVVTILNSDHVFENDFHLRGYSGNKQKFQWSYVSFVFSVTIHDKYELSLTRTSRVFQKAAFHFSYGNLTWENGRKIITDN